LQLLKRQINKSKRVKSLKRLFVDKFELNHQKVFFQLRLLVIDHLVVIHLGDLESLFLMQYAVFKVRLSECGVNLVNLSYLYKLRDHTVLVQGSLALLTLVFFAFLCSWRHRSQLLVLIVWLTLRDYVLV
jgi:hypothetical protein